MIYPHNEILNTKYKYELLLYATSWMIYTDIMLNEHMPKSFFYMIPFYKIGKTHLADRGETGTYLGR